MKFRMIQRCRDVFPIRLMCRCLRVSASGYYGWAARVPSVRTQENVRLLTRIRQLHTEADGIIGSPRIWEDLRYAGERCGRHRVARLMRQAGLRGVPQRRRWRTKLSGTPPAGTRNHLERDFTATAPQYQMGHRYHLRADSRTLAVLVCRLGFVFGRGGGLVHECAARLPARRPSGPHGHLAAARPDSSHSAFGSRVPVYLRRVPAVSGGASGDV